MSRWLIISFLLIICILPNAKAQMPVVICFDSQSNWAPYVYLQQGEVQGASIETIKAIFSRVGLPYEFKMLPWARALSSLYNYPDSHGCEVSWDVGKTKERERHLFYTLPLYRLTSGAFYSKKHNPDLGSLKGLLKIFSYNLCGIREYSYHPIDLAVKIRLANEVQAFALLEKGRCDLFLSSYEIGVYGESLGLYELSDDIDYIVAPKVFDKHAYAAISKNSERSEMLIKKINISLVQMRKNGELESIFEKYISTGTGITAQ